MYTVHLFHTYCTGWCIKDTAVCFGHNIWPSSGLHVTKRPYRVEMYNTVIGKWWNVNWTANLTMYRMLQAKCINIWIWPDQWKFSHNACVKRGHVFHGRKNSEWKFNPRTSHKGADRERIIYSSFNLRDGCFVNCQGHVPAAWTPVCIFNYHVEDWVDPSRSERVWNISPPSEFDPETAEAGRSSFPDPQTLWE